MSDIGSTPPIPSTHKESHAAPTPLPTPAAKEAQPAAQTSTAEQTAAKAEKAFLVVEETLRPDQTFVAQPVEPPHLTSAKKVVAKEVMKAAPTVSDTSPPKAARLIFLTGTSTAGKSSIMAEFERRHKDTAEQLGTDDFADTDCANLIAEHCKKEYAILSQVIDDKNLYRFLFSPPDVIHKHASEIFKKIPENAPDAVKKAIDDARQAALALYNTSFYQEVRQLLNQHKASQDERHFEAILSKAANGKTVIFDTPNAAGFFEYLRAHPHRAPVQRFLVYVPLTELARRLPGRNAQAVATGNLYNQRQYIDILNQFKHLYRKTTSAADIQVGTLKREDVEKIFKDNHMTIAAENSKARENNRAGQVVELEQYLKHFGLDKEAEVPITCDFQRFDGIFHAATQPAAVSAEQLHKWEHFQKHN